MRNRKDNKPDKPPRADSSQYGIVLPCEPAQFSEFISGLLGKPQTISRHFSGAFEIKRSEIENFHHLLTQRVQQQNEGTLMQFTANVMYNNGSSVLVNSFDDFRIYNETEPLISVGVVLSWVFLVRFQGRPIPEKQQIDISIITLPAKNLPFIVNDLSTSLFFGGHKGAIDISINHTARTWGADIEALLAGAIKHIIKPERGFRNFARKNSGYVGLGVGLALFLSSLIAGIISIDQFTETQMADAQRVLAVSADAGQSLNEKIDYLIGVQTRGVWPKFLGGLLIFFVGALIVSIASGIFAGFTADTKEPSFLLLSREAERYRNDAIEQQHKDWRTFLLSLAWALLTGVLGNWIFVYLYNGN